MSGCIDLVLETIGDPDMVVKSLSEELFALKKYENTKIGLKTCVVIYIEEKNGFVITALLTSKPARFVKRGKIIWKQKH